MRRHSKKTRRLFNIYGLSHQCQTQHFVTVSKISIIERGLCDFWFLGKIIAGFICACFTKLKIKKKEKLLREQLCTNVTP